MKNPIKQGMMLGLGLAAAGKDRAQEMMDELVKRGELTKQEAKDFMQEVRTKGQEKQTQIDDKAHQRMTSLLHDLNIATKDDVLRLEERILALEANNREEN